MGDPVRPMSVFVSAMAFLREKGHEVSMLDSAVMSDSRRVYVDGFEMSYIELIQLAEQTGFTEKNHLPIPHKIHRPGGKPKKLRKASQE